LVSRPVTVWVSVGYNFHERVLTNRNEDDGNC
jgi:hypothetical protein